MPEDPLIGVKNIITINDPLRNKYIEALSGAIASFEKNVAIIGGSENFQSILPVLPFLTYTDEGGIFESLVVDADSGFPEESEIVRVVKNHGADRMPFMGDAKLVEQEKQRLATDSAEDLARGEIPTEHQAYYRLIDFVERVGKAKESFPEFKAFHESFGERQATVRFVDYNTVQNHPIYYVIEMKDAWGHPPGDRRGLGNLWSGLGSVINGNKKRPYICETSKEDPKRVADFDNAVFNALYLDTSAVKAALDIEFPGIVESVESIQVGPFYYPGVQNYALIQDFCIGLMNQNDLHLEYGEDAHFLMVRYEKHTVQGQERKTWMFTPDRKLEYRLSGLSFPNMQFVRVPHFDPHQLGTGGK